MTEPKPKVEREVVQLSRAEFKPLLFHVMNLVTSHLPYVLLEPTRDVRRGESGMHGIEELDAALI